MKLFTGLLLFIFYAMSSIAQVKTFKINGQVKGIVNGKVYLYADNFDRKYYAGTLTVDSAIVTNGQFEIKRIVVDSNTYPYRFLFQNDTFEGVTDLVFITPRNQTVFVDTINEYIAPRIDGSAIQNELKLEFNGAFREFVIEVNDLNNFEYGLFRNFGNDIPKEDLLTVDSRRKIVSSKSDSLFIKYAAKHSASYVTLWKLIERFCANGYKEEYYEVYSLLLNEVRNSVAGKLLVNDIYAAKALSLNNVFPSLTLKNNASEKVILNAADLANKYTLVDFWFSSCSPCLKQFPVYKSLFKDYGALGFAVVGVSVDRSKDIDMWKSVVENRHLDWDQYLDENGTIATSYRVSSFPTNFLLDSKGIIIAKNISPISLELFLKTKLKLENIYDRLTITEPE